VPPHVLDRVRDDFKGRLADLNNAVDDDDTPNDGTQAARSDWDAYRRLRVAVIRRKRER